MEQKILNLNYDDGRVKYKLNADPSDDKCIYITPQDFNLPRRYKEAVSNIESYIKTMQSDAGVNEDKQVDIGQINRIATGDIEKDIDLLFKADRYVKEQIDYILDYPVSEIVFGNCSCLTVDTASGEYFCEKFLNCLVPVIEENYNTAVRKMKCRVEMYTAQKGKHSQIRRV